MIQTFARHPVAANLTMVLMIMAGVWALKGMPTQLDPPANLPLIWVEVSWRGASAEDLETLVTRPIEQQLRNLQALRELRSYTVNGFTRINVWFEYDADRGMALDDVKQKVANIRNLPGDIEPPVVRPFVDLEPVASVIVTAPGELAEMLPLVRRLERDLLQRGVEQVTFDGLPDEEIALLVSGQRLQQMGMSLEAFAAAVAAVSQNVPAGTLGVGQGSVQLRSLDQRRDTDGFNDLELAIGERVYRLGELAEAQRRGVPGQPELRKNGQAAIEMQIWRDVSGDALAANRVLEAWLQETTPTLPAGVALSIDLKVWDMLGAQLGMILKNGMSGMLLVVAVLFVFLNGRTAWWVTAGIPVSFLLALALLYSGFGYGISIIALIGLIMALGIVVDDAIVVGEEIVTQFEAGKSAEAAAIDGARRMWAPVATSSLTTLAAFGPIIAVGGVLGPMVLALPTVLLCVIVASLIECFLVLPGHLRSALARTTSQKKVGRRERFIQGFYRFRDDRFIPAVRLALRYPGATLTCAIGGVVLAASLIASGHVGFNLTVGFDFESITADAEFAASATPEQRERFVAHLEQTLSEVNEELAADNGRRNVTGWTVKHNAASFNQERVTGKQYVSLQAAYAFEEQRSADPAAFETLWRARVTRPHYVERFVLAVAGGAGGGDPEINLVLRGDDTASLKRGAQELIGALQGYAGVSNVIDNLPYGKEQIIFSLTPTGRSLGLSAQEVGRQLRAAYAGARVQIFNEDNAEIEVRVLLHDDERRDIGQLRRFPIETAGGFVALGSIAELHNRRGIDTIRHHNGQMSVAVSADVDTSVANALTIINGVKADALPAILDRHGLQFDLGGRSRQDAQMLDTMALGAVLTLVLIYLILAWAFSSYLWPFAIMLAIPFGFTGAVFGHWVMGWDFGAMSLLAFMALTGIVVNDSIVLISVLRERLRDGSDMTSALLDAVRSRFRAVVLTSLTTVAGLAPLLLEDSSLDLFFTPIAITLCFGLSFATLLVLIVIPTMLLQLERAKSWGRAFTARAKAGVPSPFATPNSGVSR
ncbi:MAG: efflux RND transporter permease subunit [Pseudomonadota bacterium]